MADRWFNESSYSLEKYPVTIFAQVAIGATGAPTLQAYQPSTNSFVTANSAGFHGVKSVTRNSAGDYTFVFQDKYTKFIGMSMNVVATSATPTALNAYVKNGGLSLTAAGGATVEVITCLGSATAADPANGNVLYFAFEFGNSSAP